VEVALVLPVLTLLLLGVIDLGRAAYYSIIVQNAAESAAIYGSTNPTDSAGIEAAAKADASNIPGGITVGTPVTGCECSNATQISVGCAVEPRNCTNGSTVINYVTVTTSYAYSPLFKCPGIPTSFTLTGSATMRQ
jgi:Flp pilus assembly protein TadG